MISLTRIRTSLRPVLALLCGVISFQALAQTGPEKAQSGHAPDSKRLWQIVQQQQHIIEVLQKELTQLKNRQNNTDRHIESQEESLQQMAEAVEDTVPAAAQTSLGGYGELHYNNTDSGNKVDFHRFVLFVGHDFSDQTRFYSELELEHVLSGDGQPGEVELEQAFIEHRFNDSFTAKAGLMLMPVGILNETHEPDTFYGVERNPVEKNILPTTWWEAGLAGRWKISQRLSADLMVSSGLNVPTSGSKAFLIRSGRQKVAKATANDGALTARIQFQPAPGLQLSALVHQQQDITQGELGIGATLLEADAQYRNGPFGLKALVARWNLDDKVKALALGREQQSGYYIEPSWRFGDQQNIGLFARYAMWDNNAGDDRTDTSIKQLTIGANYWLHPQVVFKIDYQNQSGAADEDGFNLGVGYSF